MYGSVVAGVMAIEPVAISITGALGRGSFGEVLQGSYRGRGVAVKIISGGADDVNSQVEVASEAGVMKSVQKHRNVLELVGVALFDGSTAPPLLRDVVAAASLGEGAGVLGLVIELCPCGTLKELIHELDAAGRIVGPGPDLGLVQLSEIACGIAEGCRFVHGLGVVHRDLKPENIMMSVGHVPKLVVCGNYDMILDCFLTSSTQYSAPTRAVERVPRLLPMLVGADWCLQSDGMPDPHLQDFGQSRFVALNREMTADVNPTPLLFFFLSSFSPPRARPTFIA